MRSSGKPALRAAAAILAVCIGGQASDAAGVIYKVGAVTWHAAKFVSKEVVIEGYVLAREPGYLLFSDEATGKISVHDLPVSGPGADAMQVTKKYVIEGVFLDRGLTAGNGSPYHLELTAVPTETQP